LAGAGALIAAGMGNGTVWAATPAVSPAVANAAATAPTPDKSGYTFFKPTPDALLRELTTDRPDATESPFTVDAGRVQWEMDFANYGRNRLDGVRTTEWEVAPFNLRLGLTHNVEAGVFVTPFRREIETPRVGPGGRNSGFGDVTLRTKLNLLGNDGGAWAVGLMADLKLPTANGGMSNGKCEGAITVPVAFDLGGGWGGGAMTYLELRYMGADGQRAVWGNTVTVGRDLTEKLGAFVELTSEAGDGAHVATFNGGLTFALARDVRLDGGVNLGITRTAPDAQVFVGLSRRF